MKNHLGIRGMLALVLVAFAGIPVGVVGADAYAAGRASLHGAAASALLTRTIEKQAAVETWIATARTEIAAKAQEEPLREEAAVLVGFSPGSPEAQAARDQLVRHLEPLAGPTSMFSELYVIEADVGRVIASTDPSAEGRSEKDQAYFVLGKNRPHVSEPYSSGSTGRLTMSAVAPVTAADGHLLGVLVGALDLGDLDSIVSRRTGLDKSDDAFVTDSNGVPVTQPRFMQDPATLRLPIKTEALKRCLSGGSGTISAVDYRGVRGFVSYRWLGEQNMCLVVKIDEVEAFAAASAFTRTVMLTGSLTLGIALALAFALARSLTGPIMVLQAGTERIGRGELDHRLPETGTAELRRVAREFNHMAESLRRGTAALRESESNYRSLVETATVGIYRTNTEGEVLYVNEGLVQMLGFDSAEELRASGSVVRYSSPETRQRLMAALRQSGHTDGFEAELLTKQGLVRTVLLSATQHGPMLTGVITDITERKRAEQVRHALHAISQAAIGADGLPDLYASIHRSLGGLVPTENFYIALYDSDAGLLSYPYVADPHDGPSEPRPLGRGLTEYVLRTGKSLLASPPVFDDLVRRGEVELVGTNSVDWVGVPLQVAGRVLGVMAVQSYEEDNRLGATELELMEFVSSQAALAIERKRAGDTLQAYAAKLERSNRDLQEFAYVASHDLQEPLRKVQAFSDRFATKYEAALDETGQDYLKRMRDATRRMQALINDLLSFSRVSTRAQAFGEVDLGGVARQVLNDLEDLIERTRGRVQVGELPTVVADATQLRQLMQNLIGNALKFHDATRSPLVSVSASVQKQTCVLSVEDNGIGFEPQYVDRIFKPFERLHAREHYDGSGMGLAICRRIAERHGGSIAASSTPGKGSTFRVTLPIHPPQGEK